MARNDVVNSDGSLNIDKLGQTVDDVGSLGSLSTTDKTSLVNAINEKHNEIGILSNLTTSNKTSLVSAVNENVTQLAEKATKTDLDKLNRINAPSKDRFRNYAYTTSQRNPIYLIGDSITEGSNATDYTKDNWASIIRRVIQQEADNTNYGFCNFNTNVVDSSNTTIKTFHKITRSGFAVYTDPFEPAVFGGTRITSTTIGNYLDITYTGKDAIVVYTADATYGAIVEVKVDGVVVGTIDTKVTNGKVNGSFSAPIVVSAFGEHTIRLTHQSGGTAQLCGMIYLDNANVNTPVVYNVGRSSITASDIADDMLDTYASGGMAILALGVNDQLLSRNVTTFKTKIQRVCDQILINSGALIICDFMFSLPSDNPYKIALADIAKLYPNFIFLDFATLWFQNDTINKFSKLLDSDGVHPTVEGQEHIANTLLKYMGLPYTKASFRKNSYTEVTLLNGWLNYGGAFETAGYKKYENGIVKLKGLIKSGTTAQGTVVFTLPYGYRPTKEKIYPVACGGAYGELDIDSSGNVKVNLAPNSTYFSLDGIEFEVI